MRDCVYWSLIQDFSVPVCHINMWESVLFLSPTVISTSEVFWIELRAFPILQQLSIYTMKVGFEMHPISGWRECGQGKRQPGLKTDKCLFEWVSLSVWNAEDTTRNKAITLIVSRISHHRCFCNAQIAAISKLFSCPYNFRSKIFY